jgi:DNA-binding transcriptional LysR family regulator
VSPGMSEGLMTLHQFTIFAAVANCRNLTNASQKLHITQSCVSKQMKLLQEEYGAKLYKRAAGGIELTNAGCWFLGRVVPILEQVRNLKKPLTHAISNEPDRLTVGGSHSPSALLLPLVLSRFKKLHPAIEIDCKTNNAVEIEHLVLTQDIEVAVTTRRPHSLRIVAEPFRREKIVMVVSKHHPLAHARAITLRNIGDTPLLIRTSAGSDGSAGQRLKAFSEENGININIGMRFDSPATMKEAIYQKIGIGIVYADVVKHNLRRGDFKEIKVSGLELEGKSYIVYLDDKPLSKAAADFVELLRSLRSKNRSEVKLTRT